DDGGGTALGPCRQRRGDVVRVAGNHAQADDIEQQTRADVAHRRCEAVAVDGGDAVGQGLRDGGLLIAHVAPVTRSPNSAVEASNISQACQSRLHPPSVYAAGANERAQLCRNGTSPVWPAALAPCPGPARSATGTLGAPSPRPSAPVLVTDARSIVAQAHAAEAGNPVDGDNDGGGPDQHGQTE